MTVVAARRSDSWGVLVPRALIATWGDLREVEIEKYADTVVIRPRPSEAASWRDQMIDRIKYAGLIEDLLWPAPPQYRLKPHACAKLSQGKPLSELIVEDQERYHVSIYYLDAGRAGQTLCSRGGQCLAALAVFLARLSCCSPRA